MLHEAGAGDSGQVNSRFGLMAGILTSCKDSRNILNKPQIIKWLSAL